MKLAFIANVDGALVVLESSKMLTPCQVPVDIYFRCTIFTDGTLGTA